VAVVAIATTLLTSCLERSPQGLFAISVKSGELIVVNCGDDIEAPFDIFISEIDYPDSWTVLDGESATAWGTKESRSVTPDGWSEVDESRAVELAPGHQINVFYQSSDGSARASFVVPREGLQAGGWLQPDGAVLDSPCGA
jgi:hypothetical protein